MRERAASRRAPVAAPKSGFDHFLPWAAASTIWAIEDVRHVSGTFEPTSGEPFADLIGKLQRSS